MREEWNARVNALAEVVDVVMNSKVNDKGQKAPVLAPGLKVKHKKSGYLYTVASVGPHDVILITPEGEKFLVDGQTLEQEYHLD
jgi:hypothetical protein